MAQPVIPDFGEASDCVSENRLFCPDWVRDNWDPVLQPALVQRTGSASSSGRSPGSRR
jgi:osmoprotectant transport system permease protein